MYRWRPKAIAWSSRELSLECVASDCWNGSWDPAEWAEATCLRWMDSSFKLPSPTIRWPRKWDISPGYQQHRFVHLIRAVGAGCLQCHASGLQPVAGTQNRFGDPPFREGGVSCERCHGPGKNHIAKMISGNRKGPSEIVNPVKLDAARRDSVCAQCHLTGAARIPRAQAKDETYQPGALLSDHFAYFVWTGAGSSIMGANSHFEKLQQSSCKRESGERLWCGSCHDPHGEPEPLKRIDFYRSRCGKCHELSACKENLEARRKAQDDCTACHMPKGAVRDTEHAVFTDHMIPRRPQRGAGPAGGERSLGLFWKAPLDERDLGLAFAAVAGEIPVCASGRLSCCKRRKRAIRRTSRSSPN